MSHDIECRRCGLRVSEKSIQDGTHECDEDALLKRIERLEDRIEDLEQDVRRLEGAVDLPPDSTR